MTRGWLRVAGFTSCLRYVCFDKVLVIMCNYDNFILCEWVRQFASLACASIWLCMCVSERHSYCALCVRESSVWGNISVFFLIFLLFKKGESLQSVSHLALGACPLTKGDVIGLGTQRGHHWCVWGRETNTGDRRGGFRPALKGECQEVYRV